MSKKKKDKIKTSAAKKDKYKISHTSVIHGQNSIYTNKVSTRQHKNSCVFYDKTTTKYNNKK